MPYISTEEVAKKRAEIKKAFPNWKLSITRHHHSSICVDILQADIQLLLDTEKKSESVNYFYIADHYKELPEAKDALLKIYEIINEGNRTVSVDGDYGNIPQFYVSMSVGQWDKPFVYVKGELIKKLLEPKTPVVAGQVQIIDYSEKAIAVAGDTKPIKETLKALGGRFNFHLTCGAGWVFPKTKEAEVRTALALPKI